MSLVGEAAPTTQLYEDLGLGARYTPAFLLHLAAG